MYQKRRWLQPSVCDTIGCQVIVDLETNYLKREIILEGKTASYNSIFSLLKSLNGSPYTKSDQFRFDQTRSDQTISVETVSDQTGSDQTRSDQTRSDQTRSLAEECEALLASKMKRYAVPDHKLSCSTGDRTRGIQLDHISQSSGNKIMQSPSNKNAITQTQEYIHLETRLQTRVQPSANKRAIIRKQECNHPETRLQATGNKIAIIRK